MGYYLLYNRSNNSNINKYNINDFIKLCKEDFKMFFDLDKIEIFAGLIKFSEIFSSKYNIIIAFFYFMEI